MNIKGIKWFSATLLALGSLSLTACSTVAGPEGYPAQYLQVTASDSAELSQPANPGSTERAREAFEHVFAHFKSADLAKRISESYAEELFFNDTFRTIESREVLSNYLVSTAGKTPENRVEILSVASDGADHFVRWRMQFTFEVYGRTYHTDSIGMTHLKLNDQGKIVMHQDFWDGVEGFYQHLPVIGYWVKRIRADL